MSYWDTKKPYFPDVTSNRILFDALRKRHISGLACPCMKCKYFANELAHELDSSADEDECQEKASKFVAASEPKTPREQRSPGGIIVSWGMSDIGSPGGRITRPKKNQDDSE